MPCVQLTKSGPVEVAVRALILALMHQNDMNKSKFFQMHEVCLLRINIRGRGCYIGVGV
jgi:hypothetical protein